MIRAVSQQAHLVVVAHKYSRIHGCLHAIEEVIPLLNAEAGKAAGGAGAGFKRKKVGFRPSGNGPMKGALPCYHVPQMQS